MCFITPMQLVAPTDQCRAETLNKTVGTERALYDFTTEMDQSKRSDMFHILSRALIDYKDTTNPLTVANSLSRAQIVVAVKQKPLSRAEAEKLTAIIRDNENMLSLRSPSIMEKLKMGKIMGVVGNFLTLSPVRAAFWSLGEELVDGFSSPSEIPSDVGKAVVLEACEHYFDDPAFKSLIDHIKNDEREPLPIVEPGYTDSNWMLKLFEETSSESGLKLKELQECVPSILKYSTDLAGDATRIQETKDKIQDAVKERMEVMNKFLDDEKATRLNPEKRDKENSQKIQKERVQKLHSIYRSTSLALVISEQLCHLANFNTEASAIHTLGNATAKGLYIVALFYISPSCPWTFCAELLGIANEIKGYVTSTDTFEQQCLKYLCDAVKKIHTDMNEHFSKLEQYDITILRTLNQISTNLLQVIIDLDKIQTNIIDATDTTFRVGREAKFQSALAAVDMLLKKVTPAATDVTDYSSQLIKIANFANGDSWNPAFCGHESVWDSDFKQAKNAKLEDIAGVLVPLVKTVLPDFSVPISPNAFDWPLLPNFTTWATGVYALLLTRAMTQQADYVAVADEGLVNNLIKQGEYIQSTLLRLTSTETIQKVENVVKEDIDAFKKCVSDNLSLVIQECYNQLKILYPNEKIPQAYFLEGMPKIRYNSYTKGKTAYTAGMDVTTILPDNISIFEYPVAFIDIHKRRGKKKIMYDFQIENGKAPVTGLLEELKLLGFITLQKGKANNRWIVAPEDREDVLTINKGLFTGMSFKITVYINKLNTKVVDVYDMVSCLWRNTATAYATSKGSLLQFQAIFPDMETVHFVDLLAGLFNEHLQALKTSLLANVGFSLNFELLPNYSTLFSKLYKSSTTLTLLNQLTFWCQIKYEAKYSFPLNVQSHLVSRRDLETAHKHFILGGVNTDKCLLWSEGVVRNKFCDEFLTNYFGEGLERSSILPALLKEGKTLFFIDAAVHRLYAYRNLKWLDSNAASLPPSLIPVRDQIVSLKNAPKDLAVRNFFSNRAVGVVLFTSSPFATLFAVASAIEKKGLPLIISSGILFGTYKYYKNYGTAFRGFKRNAKLMMTKFYANSFDESLFYALEAYKSSPGNKIIISFLLNIIMKISGIDQSKILPLLFQIFESQTSDLIEYYLEMYLTLNQLNKSEALLYLPPVDLPSDDPRLLLLKAWKSLNEKDYAESSKLVTALKKDDPKNWELCCLDGMIMNATGKTSNDIRDQYIQSFGLINVKGLYTWRQIELMKSMLDYFKTMGINYQQHQKTFDRVSSYSWWHD